MGRVVAAWVLLGVALALSSRVAEEYLWIMSTVPVLAWGVAGLVIVALLLWQACDQERRAAAIRHGAVMAGTVALFVPLADVGSWLTERLRFLHERPHYERLVAKANAHPPTGPYNTDAGLDYVVDSGPPVRVAFPWPGGIIDNWCGVVHDSSAEVLKVNELQVGSVAWRASAVTGLFRGDMTSCHAIEPPYYLCCFT